MPFRYAEGTRGHADQQRQAGILWRTFMTPRARRGCMKLNSNYFAGSARCRLFQPLLEQSDIASITCVNSCCCAAAGGAHDSATSAARAALE